jgi:hypothetical protein
MLVLVNTAWRVFGLLMEEIASRYKGCCEYFEEAVEDSRQGDWARG